MPAAESIQLPPTPEHAVDFLNNLTLKIIVNLICAWYLKEQWIEHNYE